MPLKLTPVDLPPKTAAPGRPKDPEKRAAILEAAKRLFTAHGYDGVSMDQIAAEAGVSKLTVYSHYGDKEGLFAAAIQAYCEQQLPDSMFDARPEIPLRERLMQVARAFFAMACAPEAIAGHRVLCAPQMVGTPLPQMFWEAGPMRVHASFAELLRRRMAIDALVIDDVPRASSQFFSLLKGEPHAQLVLGCGTSGKRETEDHLNATVDLFLRAYGPR